MRTTHTYAELEVPADLYDLVARKLIEAGYSHAFEVTRRYQNAQDMGPIDMHGIALTRGPALACPSGLAACDLNRLPVSARYAAEDKAARGWPTLCAERDRPAANYDDDRNGGGKAQSFIGQCSSNGGDGVNGAEIVEPGHWPSVGPGGIGRVLVADTPAIPAAANKHPPAPPPSKPFRVFPGLKALFSR